MQTVNRRSTDSALCTMSRYTMPPCWCAALAFPTSVKITCRTVFQRLGGRRGIEVSRSPTVVDVVGQRAQTLKFRVWRQGTCRPAVAIMAALATARPLRVQTVGSDAPRHILRECAAAPAQRPHGGPRRATSGTAQGVGCVCACAVSPRHADVAADLAARRRQWRRHISQGSVGCGRCSGTAGARWACRRGQAGPQRQADCHRATWVCGARGAPGAQLAGARRGATGWRCRSRLAQMDSDCGGGSTRTSGGRGPFNVFFGGDGVGVQKLVLIVYSRLWSPFALCPYPSLIKYDTSIASNRYKTCSLIYDLIT